MTREQVLSRIALSLVYEDTDRGYMGSWTVSYSWPWGRTNSRLQAEISRSGHPDWLEVERLRRSRSIAGPSHVLPMFYNVFVALILPSPTLGTVPETRGQSRVKRTMPEGWCR